MFSTIITELLEVVKKPVTNFSNNLIDAKTNHFHRMHRNSSWSYLQQKEGMKVKEQFFSIWMMKNKGVSFLVRKSRPR